MRIEAAMPERIHLVVTGEEKELYRRMAAREGRSLSEWLRAAAQERAAKAAPRKLDSDEALREFFAACAARRVGQGREPDWEEHKRVIERSMASGATDT